MREIAIKQVVLLLAWWLGLDLLLQLLGAAYAGGRGASGVDGADAAFAAASEAATAFNAAYGMLIHIGSLVIAVFITFPWQFGTILALVASVAYFGFGDRWKKVAPKRPAVTRSSSSKPASAPAVPGKIARLTVPVTIQLAYGNAVIPTGARVMILGVNGEVFRLKTEAGQEFTAARQQFEME